VHRVIAPEIARACLGAATDLELPLLVQNIANEARALLGASESIVWIERQTAVPVNPARGSEPAREEHLATAAPRMPAQGLDGPGAPGPSLLAGAFPLASLRKLRLDLPQAGEALADAILAVPVTAGGLRSGVLVVAGAGQDTGGRAAMAALAAALDPFLSHALAMASLRDMTVRDDVADCYNRRHLEEFLSAETERAQRFGKPLSLIFFDLDDLKSVNSHHGHAAGSRALRAVASRVSASIRRIDRLCRFGGDEFCVILPETDLGGAMRTAERVRGRIGDVPYDDLDLPEVLQLSASLGVAAFPRHAGDWKGIVAAADAAMHEVKGRGKNSVGVAEASGGSPSDGTRPPSRGEILP